MAAIYYFLYYIFLLLGYSFMYSYIFYNMIFFNHFAVIFLYVLFLIPFISYLCKNFQNLKDLIIWWVRSFFFYACGVSLLFIVFYFIRKNYVIDSTGMYVLSFYVKCSSLNLLRFMACFLQMLLDPPYSLPFCIVFPFYACTTSRKIKNILQNSLTETF